MTIAELFVNLGVKGADTSVKALSGVKEGMKEVASSGLAAKAAVVAAIYALERLTGIAAERGMELKKFSNYTGLSTEKLQKWQYAALESGVAAEDMANSIKTVQSAIEKTRMGMGTPGGLGTLASIVKLDWSKMTGKNGPFYILEKTREFLQKTKDRPAWANEVVKTWIPSEDVIQMLRKGNIELDKIKPSNWFDDSEISRLASIQVAWSKFWYGLKMVSGHLVSQYGKQGIDALSNAFSFLSDAGKNIAQLIKDFPLLGVAMEAAAVVALAAWAPVTAAISAIIFALDQIQRYREGKPTIFSKGQLIDKAADFFSDKILAYIGNAPGAIPITPNRSYANSGPVNNNQSSNQTINNYGVQDAQDAFDLWRRMQPNSAVEQNQSRAQGS